MNRENKRGLSKQTSSTMNPSHSSRMYSHARNYSEDEPPAYSAYGDSASLLENESPPRHHGPTMRLLPTSGAGVDDELDDEDLHDHTSSYQFEPSEYPSEYQSEYPDDDGMSRCVYFRVFVSWCMANWLLWQSSILPRLLPVRWHR